MCQILDFNAINTIVTDIECNIRIDRLPCVVVRNISTGPYHDPRAVCISWYCPPYQLLLYSMILKECCFTVLKQFSLKFWKLENWNEIVFVFTNAYLVIMLYNSFDLN